jgi:hypothetical protein
VTAERKQWPRFGAAKKETAADSVTVRTVEEIPFERIRPAKVGVGGWVVSRACCAQLPLPPAVSCAARCSCRCWCVDTQHPHALTHTHTRNSRHTHTLNRTHINVLQATAQEKKITDMQAALQTADKQTIVGRCVRVCVMLWTPCCVARAAGWVRGSHTHVQQQAHRVVNATTLCLTHVCCRR